LTIVFHILSICSLEISWFFVPSRHRLVSSINHSARFVGELFINHRAKHPDCRDFQKYLENSTKSILAGRINAVLRNPLTKSVRNAVTLSVERFELHLLRYQAKLIL